jgi:hypothetical protein
MQKLEGIHASFLFVWDERRDFGADLPVLRMRSGP